MIHPRQPFPLHLQNVGLFLSDPSTQQGLIDHLVAWFARYNISIVPLDWDSPQQQGLDMIITVGGDGTVLYALNHHSSCPVLAINYGNVGFLTAGNREELDNTLQRVLEGDYIISPRSMIHCQHPHGELHAVNEIVIKGATRLITVELIINNKSIRRIRGDGVIVGTATGSTAYLMAAGSPIVMPELRCMIVSGLNEYDFRSRHLVVTHDSEIRLVVHPETRESEVFLAADGSEKIPLALNDEVLVCESDRQANLIFLDANYFFHNLSSRLSW